MRILLTLTLLGVTTPALAIEWRVATLSPRGSAWMKVLERAGAEIESVTEGRVTVKYDSNGTQGDERDTVRKLRLGQLDGAALTSVGLSLIDRSVRVIDLPRMFATVEEAAYVQKKMWSRLRKGFAQKGFVLQLPAELGPTHILSKAQVKTTGDLRATKPWVWSDDTTMKALYQRLNVRGVPLGAPEVLASLTSGRIDVAYASPLSAVALQWNTKISNMSSVVLGYGVGGLVIRKETWSAMSAADRKEVQKVLRKATGNLRKRVRRDNKAAERNMTRRGVTIIEATPQMVRDLDQKGQQVWGAQVGKAYSQQELDMVLQHRADFRAK